MNHLEPCDNQLYGHAGQKSGDSPYRIGLRAEETKEEKPSKSSEPSENPESPEPSEKENE